MVKNIFKISQNFIYKSDESKILLYFINVLVRFAIFKNVVEIFYILP